MNLQFYFEKLKESDSYKEFISENPEAYFSGAFFIYDKATQGKGDEQNIDFYIPEKKELVSFCLSNNCQKNPIEMIDKNYIPEKISDSIDFEFVKIEELLLKEMEKNNFGGDVHKFLFSLQNLEGKNYILGSMFLPRLALVKFKIDLDEMKIIDFEKKSFFELMNIKKKKE